MFLTGPSNRLSLVDLHVACLEVPFAWNLCIQTQPHDIHLVPERVSESCLWEWAQPRWALPGFPPTVGGLAAHSAAAPALAKCCSIFPFQMYKQHVRARNPVQATFLLLCLCHCLNDKKEEMPLWCPVNSKLIFKPFSLRKCTRINSQFKLSWDF